MNDRADDDRLIAEAVEVASKSDVALVVVGGNEDTNKEAWAENHLGDRDSLDLVGRQDELVRQVLAGFYLGEGTGTAAADVLFGDHNPSGKLPVTFPRSVGQLPVYYNHKPTAKRGYLFADKEPLFAFGHGLSYTTFEYKNLRVTPERMDAARAGVASVEVTNTGGRAGLEVAQMYIRDDVSSVTRPVRGLRGFERVSLAPGETKTVKFSITPDDLAFYSADMRRKIEPGSFTIMVGGSSVAPRQLTTSFVVTSGAAAKR